jgi:hypothetical protein
MKGIPNDIFSVLPKFLEIRQRVGSSQEADVLVNHIRNLPDEQREALAEALNNLLACHTINHSFGLGFAHTDIGSSAFEVDNLCLYIGSPALTGRQRDDTLKAISTLLNDDSISEMTEPFSEENIVTFQIALTKLIEERYPKNGEGTKVERFFDGLKKAMGENHPFRDFFISRIRHNAFSSEGQQLSLWPRNIVGGIFDRYPKTDDKLGLLLKHLKQTMGETYPLGAYDQDRSAIRSKLTSENNQAFFTACGIAGGIMLLANITTGNKDLYNTTVRNLNELGGSCQAGDDSLTVDESGTINLLLPGGRGLNAFLDDSKIKVIVTATEGGSLQILQPETTRRAILESMAQTSQTCLRNYQERQKQQNEELFGLTPWFAPEFGVALNHNQEGIIR